MIQGRELYGIVTDSTVAKKVADYNPKRKLLFLQLLNGPYFIVNFDGSTQGIWVSGLYSWLKFEPNNDGFYLPVWLAPQATAATVNVVEV